MRRGNQLLRVRRQLGEQRVAALHIKLPKNVIQQKQRRKTGLRPDQTRLRETQRKRHSSLLAFGCELRIFFI